MAGRRALGDCRLVDHRPLAQRLVVGSAAQAAKRLPRAPQTLRNDGPSARAAMAAAPAPPPRRAKKEPPPPVPKGAASACPSRRSASGSRSGSAPRRPRGRSTTFRAIVDRGALEIRDARPWRSVSTIKKYDFDLCLGPSSTEDAVFEALGAKALLDRALRGIKAAVFAYGATGSGKTHTILGHEREDFESLPPSPGTDLINDRDRLVARAVKYLYATSDSQLQIRASFFEVYCEQIFDLLEPNSNVFTFTGGQRWFSRPA